MAAFSITRAGGRFRIRRLLIDTQRFGERERDRERERDNTAHKESEGGLSFHRQHPLAARGEGAATVDQFTTSPLEPSTYLAGSVCEPFCLSVLFDGVNRFCGFGEKTRVGGSHGFEETPGDSRSLVGIVGERSRKLFSARLFGVTRPGDSAALAARSSTSVRRNSTENRSTTETLSPSVFFLSLNLLSLFFFVNRGHEPRKITKD